MLYSKKERPICKFCEKPVCKAYYSKGNFKKWNLTCEEHFKINRKRGPQHPNATKGGRIVNNQGYIMVLDPSKSSGSRYTLEHRKVVEKEFGRPLTDREVVHHANGIRDDNRLCNLIVIDTDETKHESRTLIRALYRVIEYLQIRLNQYEDLTEQRTIPRFSL